MSAIQNDVRNYTTAGGRSVTVDLGKLSAADRIRVQGWAENRPQDTEVVEMWGDYAPGVFTGNDRQWRDLLPPGDEEKDFDNLTPEQAFQLVMQMVFDLLKEQRRTQGKSAIAWMEVEMRQADQIKTTGENAANTQFKGALMMSVGGILGAAAQGGKGGWGAASSLKKAKVDVDMRDLHVHKAGSKTAMGNAIGQVTNALGGVAKGTEDSNAAKEQARKDWEEAHKQVAATAQQMAQNSANNAAEDLKQALNQLSQGNSQINHTV